MSQVRASCRRSALIVSASLAALWLNGCGGGAAVEPIAAGMLSVPSPTPRVVPTGAATLLWDAPLTKANGTEPPDIAGYVIRYGQQSRRYTGSIFAVAPPATINGLVTGNWFFGVYTVDSAGSESADGIEVGKALP